MRGHIVVRKGKNGILHYHAVVYSGVQNGKKTYKWLSASSMKEAQDKLNEAIHFINTGGEYSNSKLTLSQYTAKWLELNKSNLSPRTFEGYASIHKVHIEPEIGKIMLRKLKPVDVQKFYSEKLSGKISSTTVRNIAMFLHGVLNQAVKERLLVVNPSDVVTKPTARHTEMSILDESQVETMLEAAKDGPYFVLFHLAVYTGLRQSELLGLRWSNVDLDMAQLSVSRSLHRLKDHSFVIRDTKTAKSRRMIALAPTSCLVLKHHLENEMALLNQIKMPFDNNRLVFCKWSGEPIIGRTITQYWHRFAKRLGFDSVRFHDLRHTHVSLLLKQGVPVKVVSERVGHANVSTTLNVYAHVMPSMQRKAVEDFDRMIGSPQIRQRLDNSDSVKRE